MTDLPRIFVGTMYCNEGDFPECGEMITSQKGVTVDQTIIANLPEKDAHNQLWSGFRKAQAEGNYELLVKIDADTVLAHGNVLKIIAQIFRDNPRITGLQAPLYDYFSDGFINGLNCFSPNVTFQDTQDTLHCDRNIDVNHDIVLRQPNLPPTLMPAGYHCRRSTELQAFHYGLHRQLKNQHALMRHVTDAWERNNRDRIRGFALIGANMIGMFEDHEGFNYDDERLVAAFNDAKKNYEKLL